MRKSAFLVYSLILLSLFLPLYGCEKKQDSTPQKVQPFTPVQKPIQVPIDKPEEQKLRSPHGNIVSKSERKVIVPPEVQKKWDSVRLIFEDRHIRKKAEYVVKLNSEFSLTGTDLKILCKDFLPDIKMERDIITSKSNEPNNPAVRVVIYERDQTIFNGWLYSKYPEIHAFEHPRYSIILKEGIKR